MPSTPASGISGGEMASSAQVSLDWIHFSTWVPGKVDARAWNPETATPLSGTYLAQLYVGTAVGSLTPVGTPVSFGSGSMAGYLDGGNVDLPGLPGAYVQVRVWDGMFGSFYEACMAAGGPVGVSKLLLVNRSETDLVGLGDFVCGRQLPVVFWLPAPTIHPPVASGGDWVLLWTPHFGYYVEESDSPLGPWVLSAPEAWNLLEVPMGTGRKFYRLFNPRGHWGWP